MRRVYNPSPLVVVGSWVILVGLVLPCLSALLPGRHREIFAAEAGELEVPKWYLDENGIAEWVPTEDEALWLEFDWDEDEEARNIMDVDELLLTGQKTDEDITRELRELKERRAKIAAGLLPPPEEKPKSLASTAFIDSRVVVLTADTFDQLLMRYPYSLVEFYAPWCGHCRKLEPELEEAARMLSDYPDVMVAKVDCTAEEVLGRRFDVRGYPTLKFFRHGKYVVDYEQDRNAADIVAFVKRKGTPATIELPSESAVRAFLAKNPTALVVFGEPNSDALLGARDAANNPILEGFAVGEVSDLNLIKKLGELPDTAKVYRSFDSKPHLISDITPHEITSAVLAHGFPYVDNGPGAWDRVLYRKLPIVILFADVNDPKIQHLITWLNKIAKSNIDTFSFLYASQEFYSRLPSLGASGDVIPTMVVVDAETTKSWPFDETKPFTPENIQLLLQGIGEGTLRPHYTSQKPPAKNDGPVLIVVGDTFEELVLDNDKDVVVEFYAPWCGHCKQLAPTWEKVGQHYKDEESVVVAKIDAAANDNPAIAIHGYPAIYLFPSGDKSSPIEYKGLTRQFSDFTTFIDENADTLKKKRQQQQNASSTTSPKVEEVHHGHDHTEL